MLLPLPPRQPQLVPLTTLHRDEHDTSIVFCGSYVVVFLVSTTARAAGGRPLRMALVEWKYCCMPFVLTGFSLRRCH